MSKRRGERSKFRGSPGVRAEGHEEVPPESTPNCGTFDQQYACRLWDNTAPEKSERNKRTINRARTGNLCSIVEFQPRSNRAVGTALVSPKTRPNATWVRQMQLCSSSPLTCTETTHDDPFVCANTRIHESWLRS